MRTSFIIELLYIDGNSYQKIYNMGCNKLKSAIDYKNIEFFEF